MTSMMNATVGHLSTAPPVTVSVTSTAVTPSTGQLVALSSASSGAGGVGGSHPATPTKDTPSKTPTATLVPIDSPMTPVAGQDSKSGTPANGSASAEASSSTGEALPNGEAPEVESTPSKCATPTSNLTPTSKQRSSTPGGKEEVKVSTATSGTTTTSTPTTSTVSNGIGLARSTGSSTVTTTSTTTSTSCAITTTTTTSSLNGGKDLPKALIKPNTLTHVIDGFIIQEANEPFPVTRQRYADKDIQDEPPKKKAAMQEDIKPSGIASATPPPADIVACEQCGKLEHKTKLKKKRFCSPACARQAKNGVVSAMETNGLGTGGIVAVDAMALVDKLDEAMAEAKMQAEALQPAPVEVPVLPLPVLMPPTPIALGLESFVPMDIAAPVPLAPIAPAGVVTLATPAISSSMTNGAPPDRPPISSWTVDEVSNFIRELTGCQDYVDDFIQQEIDGQALLLLKENHLVSAMGMKLGPALKIVAKVESMKEVPPPPAGEAGGKEAGVTQ
ncbi:hypothetical protein KR026_009184 [Drosophila bipectinata]|nr:hypothetical protein KR026_009184 [Drosophila bipectinata]